MTAYTDDEETAAARALAARHTCQSVAAHRSEAATVLDAVADQIAARAKREAMPEAAEWLREWFATGPDPAQGVRLIQEFVAWAQVGDGPHYRRYIDGNHCPTCAEHVERNAVGDWPPDEPIPAGEGRQA